MRPQGICGACGRLLTAKTLVITGLPYPPAAVFHTCGASMQLPGVAWEVMARFIDTIALIAATRST